MRDPEMILTSLLIFFTVLVVSLLFSTLLRRFNVPWAVALIFGGAIAGPHGLGWIELNNIVMFLSEIGVIFLMFLAGMETRISAIKAVWRDGLTVAVISGVIPAIIGTGTGLAFGYGWDSSLVLAVIFMSSSFAVVIPTLEARGIIHSSLGRVIISSTMIQDIASLIFFAVLLQFISPEDWVPLPILITALAAALIAGILAKQYISQIRQWLQQLKQHKSHEQAMLEQDLTLTVVLLVGAAIIFELLRMETIVGAFFAGLIISEVVRSRALEDKIHTLGYGIFIPVFFVVVGAWVDMDIFLEEIWTIIPLTVAILSGSALTKFVSGWLAAKALGYSSYQSSLIGITSIPQLITTLAVVLVGQHLGLLPPELVAAIVILSIATVVISPLITNRLLRTGPPIQPESTDTLDS